MTAKKKVEPVVFNEPEVSDIFAGLDEMNTKHSRYGEDEGKRRSAAFGACPLCSKNKLGLVRQGVHLVWRDHTYQTHGGLSLQCSSTGQYLCEVPGRDVSDINGEQPPTCPCGRPNPAREQEDVTDD